jgi:hypothetical protein
MIVKILSSSATFSGVRYNTNKIDSGKGELMKVSGFGALNALGVLRPEDYRNQFKAVSALNKRVSHAQFHAIISTQGRMHDQYALTEIATEWLEKMGYGGQPYLIVFHKDTENNHVHVVSARVGRDGRKISSAFEKIRGSHHLNAVLGLDEKQNAKLDIAKAMFYAFSTSAQFGMILESRGYVVRETGDRLTIIKFGVQQGEVNLAAITQRMQGYRPDAARLKQLKALFRKYAALQDTALVPKTVALPGAYAKISKGFTSDFTACLKEKLGLELVYHASGDKPPYGYTVIDHATKMVVKGSEVMQLKALLSIQPGKEHFDEQAYDSRLAAEKVKQLDESGRHYYAAILKAALYNYPDLMQGLQHQGLTIIHHGANFTLADTSTQTFMAIEELLDEKDYHYLVESYAQWNELGDEIQRQLSQVPGVFISSDIDDEAIHGRKRKGRKRGGGLQR